MIGKTSFLFHSLIKYLIDTRHSANKSLFSHCVCNYFCIKLEYIQSPDWESSAAAAAAASLQSCPTLCDPRDGSPPGSPVPGILQARTLEWLAISFSNAWKWKVKGKSLSHVRLFATPWTAAHQAPLSMGFSRQDKNKINFKKKRKDLNGHFPKENNIYG